MKLKQVRCTTCGFPMSIDITAKQHTCDACGNSFVSNIAQKLNENKMADIDVLKNSRINLERSIESNDLNAILHFTNIILGMIPEDFIALYYSAYASSKLTNPKAFHSFLKKNSYDATDDDVQNIVNHIANHADLRDRKIVLQFVEYIQPASFKTVKETFEKRIQKENDYAVVKRDVFICHRSTDQEYALKVLETLESDGYTCWISYRNLRPDDNENYWENIEQAIKHCDIFLVVSSQDAMLSKDVQTEIQMASDRKMKRLEYKIDHSIHTTLFKHFFSGLKWINAIHNEGLEELKLRVYDLHHLKTLGESKKVRSAENEIPIHRTNTEGLIKRAYFEVSMGKFEEASKNVDRVFDNDIENEDAWIIKLLISEQVLTLEELYEKLSISVYSYFDGLKKSEAYQALVRFNSDHQVVDKINTYHSSAKERYIFNLEHQKKEALNKGNKDLLIRLAQEYPEPARDNVYMGLVENEIYSIDELKKKCSLYDDIETIKDIFNHPKLKEYIDFEEVKECYNLFNKTQREYKNILIEQQQQKDAEKNRLFEEMDKLISNKEFTKAAAFCAVHQELFNDEPRKHFWVLCIKYKISSINEFTEVCLTIEDKRKIINDSLVNKLSTKEQNQFHSIIQLFIQDVKEYDQKKLEISKIKRKKRYMLTGISIFVILSIWFLYANSGVKVDIVDLEDSQANIPEDIGLPGTMHSMVQVGTPDTEYIVPVGVNDIGRTTVSGGYRMAKTETTYDFWYKVKVWALANGYRFQNQGREGSHGSIGQLPTTAAQEPVTSISWRDIIVWLNALSEMHGLDPIYRSKEGLIFRDSTDSAIDSAIQTNNNGYRLPTSDEWEMAARWKDDTISINGSILVGGRYWTPWNYASGAIDNYAYESATRDVAWYWGSPGGNFTRPVGQLSPNHLGLYDMSGNVWEWTDTTYGVSHVVRGGSWYSNPDKNFTTSPSMSVRSYFGFRFVRNP